MIKSKCLLYHVYAGTQGTAGLYLNEIINAVKTINISQKAFVSYYYPFGGAKKMFYKYTDLASGIKKTSIRPYIRYLELIYGLIYLFLNCLIDRPKFINYSLNSSYLPEYVFLIVVRKMLKIKIIITCHDVVPFENNYLNIAKENKRRDYLLKTADFLLVHNENSKNDLLKYYFVKPDRIIHHPFPIMNLNFWQTTQRNKNIDYLFIGHLRKEKGIEILLEAWTHFFKEHPLSNLYVVGNLPSNTDFDVEKYKCFNVCFILNYVDDLSYTNLIASSKCVVLPYLRGTNSGIPSSVISMKVNLIVSDIPMFRNNVLIPKESFFKSSDSFSLFQKMEDFWGYEQLDNTEEKLSIYQKDFVQEVSSLYYNMIQKRNQ